MIFFIFLNKFELCVYISECELIINKYDRERREESKLKFKLKMFDLLQKFRKQNPQKFFFV